MKDTGLDRIGRDGRLTTGAGGGCNVCQCLRLSGAAAACPLRPGLRGDCVEVYSARPSLTSLASLAFITTTYAHHMSAFIQRISTHLHTCPRAQTRLCRVSELWTLMTNDVWELNRSLPAVGQHSPLSTYLHIYICTLSTYLHRLLPTVSPSPVPACVATWHRFMQLLYLRNVMNCSEQM